MSSHTLKIIKHFTETVGVLLLVWFLLFGRLGNYCWGWCSDGFGGLLLLFDGFEGLFDGILSGWRGLGRSWSSCWLLFLQDLLYGDFNWCWGLLRLFFDGIKLALDSSFSFRGSGLGCWWNHYGDLNLLWSFLRSSSLYFLNFLFDLFDWSFTSFLSVDIDLVSCLSVSLSLFHIIHVIDICIVASALIFLIIILLLIFFGFLCLSLLEVWVFKLRSWFWHWSRSLLDNYGSWWKQWLGWSIMLGNHNDWSWLVKGLDHLHWGLCEFLSDWHWLRVRILMEATSEFLQGLLNGKVFGSLVDKWEGRDGLGILELFTWDDWLSTGRFHVLLLGILGWSHAKVSGSGGSWLHHFNGNWLVEWMLLLFFIH